MTSKTVQEDVGLSEYSRTNALNECIEQIRNEPGIPPFEPPPSYEEACSSRQVENPKKNDFMSKYGALIKRAIQDRKSNLIKLRQSEIQLHQLPTLSNPDNNNDDERINVSRPLVSPTRNHKSDVQESPNINSKKSLLRRKFLTFLKIFGACLLFFILNNVISIVRREKLPEKEDPIESGNYNEVIAQFTKAIELSPTFAKAYYGRGIAQYLFKKYNEAIADFTKAIELDPTDADVYYSRGDARYELNEYNEAIADHTKAIELNSTHATAYNSRGMAHKKLGKYNEAIADYTKAIELNPSYANAYKNRGIAQSDFRKYKEAVADYTKAIELDPTNANAYHYRGSAHYEIKKYNEAIADFTKAIELDPNPTNANAYYNRGLIQYNLKKYNEAIADFTKFIELNPTDANADHYRGNALDELNIFSAYFNSNRAIAYYNRGRAQENLGKYNEAIADYTKVIELNPKFYLAINKKKKLMDKINSGK